MINVVKLCIWLDAMLAEEGAQGSRYLFYGLREGAIGYEADVKIRPEPRQVEINTDVWMRTSKRAQVDTEDEVNA